MMTATPGSRLAWRLEVLKRDPACTCRVVDHGHWPPCSRPAIRAVEDLEDVELGGRGFCAACARKSGLA